MVEKSILIIFSVAVLFQQSIIAQKIPGIINDPDGYANLRSGNALKFEIIEKIREGERFEYEADSSSDWWPVTTKKGIKGFLHKSRIQPYFIDHENSCLCKDNHYEEMNVDLSVNLSNHNLSVCGYLLQRNSTTKIKISEFIIYDCTDDEYLAFYDGYRNYNVEYTDNELMITELENLPTGSNWKWQPTPIYRTTLSEINGEIKFSDKKKGFYAGKISKSDINKLNEEAYNFLKSGEKPPFDMCENYMARLFVSAMKGNQISKEILLNFTKYYHVIPDGALSEMYECFINHLRFYGVL